MDNQNNKYELKMDVMFDWGNGKMDTDLKDSKYYDTYEEAVKMKETMMGWNEKTMDESVYPKIYYINLKVDHPNWGK